jgi:hypothetical protein
MGAADASGTPSPHAGDATAMAEVERAMAIIDRAMPSCRFKVSILHRLTLFMADWRWRLGRRTCRDCQSEFHVSQSEADWCRTRKFNLPSRCKACRAERRRARD